MRPISIENNKVKVINTYVLDATVQILATRMVDYIHYASFGT